MKTIRISQAAFNEIRQQLEENGLCKLEYEKDTPARDRVLLNMNGLKLESYGDE
jgi:hypothetical protein